MVAAWLQVDDLIVDVLLKLKLKSVICSRAKSRTQKIVRKRESHVLNMYVLSRESFIRKLKNYWTL